MIKCCLTDEERLLLIKTAGKGLLEAEAQDILDACAPSSAIWAYNHIQTLQSPRPSISTGCASFLARNLTERQHLQLRCELGPFWNMYVGLVDGHYAFDTNKDVDALTLLASKCKINGPDTTTNQDWRNGRTLRAGRRRRASPGTSWTCKRTARRCR